MEQLNSVFDSIEGFSPSHPPLLSKSTCLWVWNADKVPPHVGISSNGLYYSLKVNGKDWQVPISVLFDVIEKKNIPTLCFILRDKVFDLATHFEKYERAEAGNITCLFPIRDLLNLEGVGQLSELLNALSDEDRIDRCIGFNLPENYSGIPAYSIEEIHRRLEQLMHE